MAITALSIPPSRNDPLNFADRGDIFLAGLPTFAEEANALQANVNAKEASATNSAAEASANAMAAVLAGGASKWISGTSYSAGDLRWSPLSLQSYRRKSSGSGTTDPSLDGTNWGQISSVPSQTGHGGKFLSTDGSIASWKVVSDTVQPVIGTTFLSTHMDICVITNSSTTTITLPSSPNLGDYVIVNISNNLNTNIISRNSSTIMGKPEDLIVDSTDITIKLQYLNNDWKIL